MGFAEGTGLFWLAGMANGVRFFGPPYWKIEQRPSAPRRIRTMMGDTFKYVAGETVMYFSKEAIQNLAESYGTMNARAEALIVSQGAKYFLVKNFVNDTNFFEWDKTTYNFYFRKLQDATELSIH